MGHNPHRNEKGQFTRKDGTNSFVDKDKTMAGYEEAVASGDPGKIEFFENGIMDNFPDSEIGQRLLIEKYGEDTHLEDTLEVNEPLSDPELALYELSATGARVLNRANSLILELQETVGKSGDGEIDKNLLTSFRPSLQSGVLTSHSEIAQKVMSAFVERVFPDRLDLNNKKWAMVYAGFYNSLADSGRALNNIENSLNDSSPVSEIPHERYRKLVELAGLQGNTKRELDGFLITSGSMIPGLNGSDVPISGLTDNKRGHCERSYA